MMTFLRIACGIVGPIAIYSSVFLYEDEEGRAQTKLEGLWLRLADRRSNFVSRHYRAFQSLALAASRVLDQIFGERTVSWRFLAASLLLSFASFSVSGWLGSPPHSSSLLVWGLAFTLGTLAPLVSQRLALVPIIVSLVLVIRALFFGLVRLGFLLTSTHQVESAPDSWFLGTWGLAVPLSLGLYVLLLSTLRWLLRSAAEDESVLGAIAKLVALGIVMVVVLTAPFWLASVGAATSDRTEAVPSPHYVLASQGLTHQRIPTWRDSVRDVAEMSLFTVLPAILYALGLLTVIFHKVAWEGVLRPLYAIQRFKPLFRYRRISFCMGWYLLAFAIAPGHTSPAHLIRGLVRLLQ